ncbi:flagellar hook-length control protein FliK [Pseudaeromonas sp. ZJS20]|uniref:flagellar hook-length control protein FliK n=1 Tax=Pseudaeromonas aegiceratis TaxID=3153928 RepID=UPI00390CCFD1
MPVITPSSPSPSAPAASQTSSAGPARQDDFARLMGQANERSGGAASPTRRTASRSKDASAAQTGEAQTAARANGQPSRVAREEGVGTASTKAQAKSQGKLQDKGGKKLPQDEPSSETVAEAQAGGVGHTPLLGQAEAGADAHKMVDAATESTSTATGAQEAANWEGDGEAWLSHLQASREQPAELSGKPSRPTADGQGEAVGALPGADPAQAKAPHGQGKGHASTSGDDQAELLAAGELAAKPGSATAKPAGEAGEALSAEFVASTQEAVAKTQPGAEHATGKHKTARAQNTQNQSDGMAQLLAATQSTTGAADSQQGELKGAYLSGLASGGVAAAGGNQAKAAGLGKVVNAATHKAGQSAGALVGQEGTDLASGTDPQQQLAADGSERTLEQLSTSQGLAALGSQAAQSASGGETSSSALSPATAAHGSAAHLAALAQAPQLAEKSDRLPTNLPSLTPMPMTTNLSDNADQLGQRLTLMLGQKWHEAELQLEPEGLGKMRIQLKMDQDQQAQVHIMVQHPQTKELVDQALPRLRDMLAGQGIQMSQAQVQQHSGGQQGAGAQGGQWGNEGQGAERGRGQGQNASASEEPVTQSLAIHSTGSSGIDFYA